MSKESWKPWHQVVQLSDELKKGELSLSQFAADLYDVAMNQGSELYRTPAKFFAYTYPTYSMRELAKDVAARLAAKNDKAVRQLELTYGGGKTHTLITLYHLFNAPEGLPAVQTVQDFKSHIDIPLPKARIAILSFDKIDLETGMKVRAPNGRTRSLKHPWSILAYQLAGDEGLKTLKGSNSVEERETYPAEPVLQDVLSIPSKNGLATLILLDEVLMYARVKIALDPTWKDNLLNFFQCLTQAATKLPNCAIVASLLATDPKKNDALGKEIVRDLSNIFRREKEEGVQPVQREDVAEILRRRFFVPSSISDTVSFKPHVVEALKGITDLDEQTKKEGEDAEKKYLRNYPFHPDLTDVFYTKWTSLDGFQKTRGILRTFALALRDSCRWDQSPLIGVNVFLAEPSKEGLSEAARELAGVATSEEYENQKQEWAKILEGELAKARSIQSELPGLKHREIEQAVFATFLHSQPIAKKALTHDLMVLLGSTRPYKIEVTKGLMRWTEVSWFLDEDVSRAGKKDLPDAWRLGSRPNLKHIHDDAVNRITPDLVEARLMDEISRQKGLTAGASASGAVVHNLPERPRDVGDDGEFRFVILGPKAASEPGKPSPEAAKFINETTAPDRPRVYRNAVVIVTPAKDLLEGVRDNIRDYLAWEEVKAQLSTKGNEKENSARMGNLMVSLDASKRRIPDAIIQAYCIVVTVSDKDDFQAFKVTLGSDQLFAAVKADKRSRIMDQAITASALLPDGPYNLWGEGEASKRVSDIVGMFAQFPRLPKMLRRREVLDTLVQGAVEGEFVLRVTRPDRTVRTFWYEQPGEAELKDSTLELVLPQGAQITSIKASLLEPGRLPELWTKDALSVKELHDYFSGNRRVKIHRTGYDDTLTIPKAEPSTVDAAIMEAVRSGKSWLVSGPASIMGQDVPPGLLTEDATLRRPPSSISVIDLLPASLKEAWEGERTTAYNLQIILSKKANVTLPWITVREAISGALGAGLFEVAPDSMGWPCDEGNAKTAIFALKIARPPPTTGKVSAEADLSASDIQDLSEKIGEIVGAGAGMELRFRIRIEASNNGNKKEGMEKLNAVLKAIKKELELR